MIDLDPESAIYDSPSLSHLRPYRFRYLGDISNSIQSWNFKTHFIAWSNMMIQIDYRYANVVYTLLNQILPNANQRTLITWLLCIVGLPFCGSLRVSSRHMDKVHSQSITNPYYLHRKWFLKSISWSDRLLTYLRSEGLIYHRRNTILHTVLCLNLLNPDITTSLYRVKFTLFQYKISNLTKLDHVFWYLWSPLQYSKRVFVNCFSSWVRLR